MKTTNDRSNKTQFSLIADRRVYEVSPRASLHYIAPQTTHEGGLQVVILKGGDLRSYWIGQAATSAQNIPGLHRTATAGAKAPR